MTHHHVRTDPVSGQHLRQRQVGGQHRRLGDLGLSKFLVGLGDRGRIVAVDEDVVGERLAQNRCHDAIGLFEDLCDDRLALSKSRHHVDVLRALPRVQEGRLVWFTTTDEHALVAEKLPGQLVARLQGIDRSASLGGKIIGVSEVDRHSHLGAKISLGRRSDGRGCALPGVGHDRRQPGGDGCIVGSPDDHRTPQRSFRFQRRRLDAADLGVGSLFRTVPVAHDPSRDVFLEHDVEVGATEPEGADTRGSDLTVGRFPLLQFGVGVER